MISDDSNLKEGLKDNSKRKSSFRGFVFWLMMPISFWFLILFLFLGVPSLENSSLFFEDDKIDNIDSQNKLVYEKELQTEISRLQKKLDKLTPGGVYLVVNTSDNTFYLYQNKTLIRHGLCSTGSYVKLEVNDKKNWLFKTPKGVFSIQGKITSPVWRKPDWAFVEEGLPIPSANSSSRFEYGVLGDYALSLGKGYLIHGTLYKRFLGQPVTHGCIRMNDDDLKTVYQSLPIGAKVFIY